MALGHEPLAERAEQAEQVAARVRTSGRNAVAIGADLADPEEIASLVARAGDAVGPLDVVVNNAAASGRHPWRKVPLAEWDYVQAVNVRAAWLVARAAHPDLLRREHASIINVTSIMVETGQPGGLRYTASKAAIIGITRAIRTEDEVSRLASDPETSERTVSGQALKRRGYADDLTGDLVYLAGDDSAFVTGQVLNVDGGCAHY